MLCLCALLGGRALGAEVTLAWSAGNSAGIVGYRVYCGTNSASYQTVVQAGNNTSATLRNLIPGKTYYLAATSVSVSGLESAFSSQLAYIVPVPTGARLKLSPLPNRQVLLTASCPTNRVYDVMRSTNCVSWTAIGAATSDIYGCLQFTNTPATNSPIGFYRLKLR